LGPQWLPDGQSASSVQLAVQYPPTQPSYAWMMHAPVAQSSVPSVQASPTFPVLSGQSLSEVLVHPVGQQPSPDTHWEMLWWAHATLQLAALPVSVSIVQAAPSSQLTGQFPSQVSPDSTVPFPQLAEQSPSLLLLQPAGQQPSPEAHVVLL